MIKLKIDLPSGFLNEEVRCGYVISSKVKELWAVELDLLAEFKRICDKHRIVYMADGGTLLGAVRHHGFIPWDDDIDVSMSRSDYNFLCSVAASEFKFPYFFQNETSDPGSARGHAQLRNSLTTCILDSEKEHYYPFNQGVFIDIFPRDNIPDDINDRRAFFRRLDKLSMNSQRYVRFYLEIYSGSVAKRTVQRMLRRWYIIRFGMRYNNGYYKQLEQEKQKYDRIATKEVANCYSMPINTRSIWESTFFARTMIVPFEFMSIPIPVNYEGYLNHTYGEWKTFVRGASIHGKLIFDTNVPFPIYNKKNDKL